MHLQREERVCDPEPGGQTDDNLRNAHIVAESVGAGSGGDFHCDDFVADGNTNRTSYFHGWKDSTGYSSTGRRQSKTDDLVSVSGLDQSHGVLLRKLKHRKEYSFGHADRALIGTLNLTTFANEQSKSGARRMIDVTRPLHKLAPSVRLFAGQRVKWRCFNSFRRSLVR